MKKLFCFCITVILLALPCFAAEYDSRFSALGADELYKAMPESAEEIELDPNISFNDGLEGIWKRLCREMRTVFSEGVR